MSEGLQEAHTASNTKAIVWIAISGYAKAIHK